MTEPQKVIENFKERILEQYKTNYVYLRGCYATNTFDEYSDIDFMVICGEIPSIEDRKEISQKKYVGTDSKRNTDVFRSRGFKLDIKYVTEETLKRIISSKSKDYLNFIINTKALSENHYLIESEKNDFKASEFTMSDLEIKRKLDGLDNDLRKLEVAMKRDNYFYITYLLNYYIERFLEIIFSLEGRPYIYPKKSEFILRELELPENLIDDLTFISKRSNLKKDLEKKIERIKNIIKCLRGLLNGDKGKEA